MNTWVGQSRWRTRGNRSRRGGGNDMQAYLQLPENLWLATGLEVLQSLGPEAVLLVQGAIATRRADESMTTQEPEHESGTVVSRLALLTKAAREMQFVRSKVFLENLSNWGFTVNSLAWRGSNAEESARLDKAFKKSSIFTKVTPKKKQKIESMWHKSSGGGEKKRCEETDKADVSLGALGAFWGNVFGVDKGWQKKTHLCETPKSWWAVSKADEKENTWERREKDSLAKHKTCTHTT